MNNILSKFFNKKHKPMQKTFCYCPECSNELIGSKSFVEDNLGLVTFQCTKCGSTSKWFFNIAPTPILADLLSDNTSKKEIIK